MKKLFAILLSVAFVLSMSVTAFAAESPTTNTGGNTTIDVTGTFVASSGVGDKISVEISWDEMKFTYTEGAKGEWLPDQHKYAEDAVGSWSTDTATITVTNHSNTPIKAKFSFDPNVTGVIGNFSSYALSLPTAENTAVSEAPSASAEFGISGASIAESQSLGVITVNIGTPTVVSDATGLATAIAARDDVVLASNITLSETLTVIAGSVVNIDLDGNTLSLNSADSYVIKVEGDAVLNVSDGVVSGGRGIQNLGSLSVSDSELSSEDRILMNASNGSSVLSGCTLTGTVYVDSGNVDLIDNTAFASGAGKITVLGGVATCCFDPTDMTTDTVVAGDEVWKITPGNIE